MACEPGSVGRAWRTCVDVSMGRWTQGLVRWVAVGALLGATAQVAMADRTYRVVKGDDCAGIAERQLGSRRDVVALHRENPHLGAEPHELHAGDILQLPGDDVTVATLRDVVGDVTMQTQLDDAARPAAIGVTIPAGTTLTTGTGRAVVQYVGGATFQLDPGTVIHVDAPRAGVRIELGRITTTATSRPYVITSKWARVTGAGAVVVSNYGTAVSNHSAKRVRVELLDPDFRAAQKARTLPPGTGIYVGTRVGGAHPKVEALPTPTTWRKADIEVLSDDTGAPVEFFWDRTADAQGSYRVVIRAEERPDETVLATRPQDPWNRRTLIPGRYRVAVAVLNYTHLESLPSEQLTVTVRRVDAPWLPRDTSTIATAVVPRLPLGARITLPATSCDVVLAPPATPPADTLQDLLTNPPPATVAPGRVDDHAWMVSTAGPQVLRCGDQTLAFDVAPVTVRPRSSEWLAPEMCVELELAGPMIGTATLVARPGATVLTQDFGNAHSQLPYAGTGCLRFAPLLDASSTPGISATVSVPTATTYTFDVVLNGSIALGVLELAPPTPLRDPSFPSSWGDPTSSWFPGSPRARGGYDLSTLLAAPPVATPRLEFAVGLLATSRADVAAGGGVLRAGRDLPHRLTLEADASVESTTARGHLVGGHAGIGLRLWHPRPSLELRPLLRVGGVTSIDGDRRALDLSAGAAVLWQATSRAGLRLDAHAVLDATTGAAHVEGGLALVTWLGP